jgi:hypothetical protein
MNWESKPQNGAVSKAESLNLPTLTNADLTLNAGRKTGILASFNRQKWFIKLTNKEYWDGRIFFLPLIFYIPYLAARARSFFFFTAANPAIPTGGMVGESKEAISRFIPPQYRPKTVVFRQGMSLWDVRQLVETTGLQFPVVLKPTVGCRGLMVQKANAYGDIFTHLTQYPTDFLAEEFIDLPIEAAVLYWKNPETGKSGIDSITIKEFLSVIGDGERPVLDLLMDNPRGVLQVERLSREQPNLMTFVPKLGEKLVVEPIGNHCRGTKFLNYNHLISAEMVAGFDKIQADLTGCYLYRLDLKVPSLADLQAGRNVKIMEINGVGSDPAHIFDPSVSLFEMCAAYVRLWRKIYEIGTALNRRGEAYMTYANYKNFVAQQAAVVALQKEI